MFLLCIDFGAEKDDEPEPFDAQETSEKKTGCARKLVKR